MSVAANRTEAAICRNPDVSVAVVSGRSESTNCLPTCLTGPGSDHHRREGNQLVSWSGQLDSNTFRFLPQFQIVIPSEQLLVGRLRGSFGATDSMPNFFDLQDP